MSINSITTATTASSNLTTQAVSGRGGHRHDNHLLNAAAKALGLSEDDLVTQLKSGKSLDDIATAQGVSHDNLAAAIKQSLPPQVAASTKADSMVDSILSKKGLPGRPQAPPPAVAADPSSSGVLGSSLTESQQNTLDSLSSLLGVNSDSLIDSLRSGASSLSDLLSAKGVDQSTLASILQDGLLFDATA